MSVSIEVLNALKASQGGCSDYRAAKLLGVAQQTITKYKQGIAPMSPEKMIIACDLAGLNALEWLMRLNYERARCDAEKHIWNDAIHRLAA